MQTLSLFLSSSVPQVKVHFHNPANDEDCVKTRADEMSLSDSTAKAGSMKRHSYDSALDEGTTPAPRHISNNNDHRHDSSDNLSDTSSESDWGGARKPDGKPDGKSDGKSHRKETYV